MKKEFGFDLNGITSLATILKKGLKGYATNQKNVGGITTIWCFLCDDAVLTIQSTMNDLSGWDEVGTLVFRFAGVNENLPAMTNLPSTWNEIFSVGKLVLDDDDFSAESGLELENKSGEILTIICGANICSIQIQAPFFPGPFFPEYDIDKYERMLLT